MSNDNRRERQEALIAEQKSLDKALKETGSYETKTWSNRTGGVLTPVSIPGVYTSDRPFLWHGIDVGSRMTVIQLSSKKNEKSELWIHSPVALDDELRRALDNLGKVMHVISPNYEHVKFAHQWAEAYPEANMWACPGLAEREPQVSWKGEVPYGIRPKSWFSDNATEANGDLPQGFWNTDELELLHVDCEVNPFAGKKPFFNEVIFYHTPSKTLVTTDFFWNYPKGDGITNSSLNKLPHQDEDWGAWELAPTVDKVPWGSRLWKFLMDKIYNPFYRKKMITKEKKPDFLDIVNFLSGSNGWDIETVIPAHGDTIRGKEFVRAVLKKHFNQS